MQTFPTREVPAHDECPETSRTQFLRRLPTPHESITRPLVQSSLLTGGSIRTFCPCDAPLPPRWSRRHGRFFHDIIRRPRHKQRRLRDHARRRGGQRVATTESTTRSAADYGEMSATSPSDPSIRGPGDAADRVRSTRSPRPSEVWRERCPNDSGNRRSPRTGGSAELGCANATRSRTDMIEER